MNLWPLIKDALEERPVVLVAFTTQAERKAAFRAKRQAEEEGYPTSAGIDYVEIRRQED